MNFGLIPMPASEELAMAYAPSASFGANHIAGDPIPFRVIAVLYLLTLLIIFQFPSGEPSPEVQAATAEHGATVEITSCPGCIRAPLSTHETKE